jgi:hypothetical protein
MKGRTRGPACALCCPAEPLSGPPAHPRVIRGDPHRLDRRGPVVEGREPPVGDVMIGCGVPAEQARRRARRRCPCPCRRPAAADRTSVGWSPRRSWRTRSIMLALASRAASWAAAASTARLTVFHPTPNSLRMRSTGMFECAWPSPPASRNRGAGPPSAWRDRHGAPPRRPQPSEHVSRPLCQRSRRSSRDEQVPQVCQRPPCTG